jgi:hypothetical protein
MGFFSQLKKGLKNQMASQMPVLKPGMTVDRTQPQQSRFAPQVPKQPSIPAVLNRPSAPILNKEGITSLPQENLNLDFLKRLPKNMMPNLDFSSLPKVSQDPLNIPEGFGVEQDRNTGQYYYLQQLTPEQKAENRIPERREISYDTPNMMDNMQFSPQFGGMVPGYADGVGPAEKQKQESIGRRSRRGPPLSAFQGLPSIPGLFSNDKLSERRSREDMGKFLNTPNQQMFGLENQIQRFYNIYEMAVRNNNQEMADFAQEKIDNLTNQKINIGAEQGDRQRREDINRPPPLNLDIPELFGEGGEASSFPDLSGDGKTTFKDVLIGRGVDFKAAGGETVLTAPRLPARSKGSSDADRFFASYVSNPIEDESFRRSSIQDELLALLEESEGNLSNQDLMMIQNMLDQGNNQPYQMV